MCPSKCVHHDHGQNNHAAAILPLHSHVRIEQLGAGGVAKNVWGLGDTHTTMLRLPRLAPTLFDGAICRLMSSGRRQT